MSHCESVFTGFIVSIRLPKFENFSEGSSFLFGKAIISIILQFFASLHECADIFFQDEIGHQIKMMILSISRVTSVESFT